MKIAGIVAIVFLLLASSVLFSTNFMVPDESQTTSEQIAPVIQSTPYLTFQQTSQQSTLATPEIVSSNDDINARFAGLLSHIRWLFDQENTSSVENHNHRIDRGDSLVWRQFDTLMDNTSENFTDLGEAFDTSILTVDTTATIEGDLTVIGSTTLASLMADSLRLPSLTPANTTNLLYNTAGDLYWQGNLIAGNTIGNWNTNGTDAYRLTGNVGIGTANPSELLDVNGNISVSGGDRTIFNRSSNSLSLGTNNIHRLTIAENGNVGIGTTAPNFNLDIVGTIRILRTGLNGDLVLDAITDVSPNWSSNTIVFRRSHGTIGNQTHVTNGQFLANITFRNHTRGNGASMVAFTTEDHSLTQSGTAINFSVVPNGTNNPVESLMLWHNRNIGISSSTPSARLSVRGAGTGTGFLAQFTDSANTPRVTVLDNGSVGIGTAAPNQVMTVAVNDPIIEITDASASASQYRGGINFRNSIESVGFIGFDNVSRPGGFLNMIISTERFGNDIIFQGHLNAELMRLTAIGRLGIGTSTPAARLSVRGAGTGTGLLVQFTDSANTPRVTFLDNGNIGIATTTPSAVLTVSGTVRFATITGGTLQTDALGNVTASSDERLKDIDGNYTAGIEEILGLEPIQYNWTLDSGFDTETLYAGFSAQNVQEFLPAAVGQNPDGFLTLSDRPIIAALVNAVKEVWERLTGVESRVDEHDAELEYLRNRVEQLEAALNIESQSPSPTLQSENSPSSEAPSVAPEQVNIIPAEVETIMEPSL